MPSPLMPLDHVVGTSLDSSPVFVGRPTIGAYLPLGAPAIEDDATGRGPQRLMSCS